MAMTAGVPAKDLKQENPTGWKHLASATRCSRCGGLMVTEQCIDLLDESGHRNFRSRRCVQCGRPFAPHNWAHKLCSHRCRLDALRRR